MTTLILSRAEQQRALEHWPAIKRFQQQLWGAHNSFVEGTYPPQLEALIAPKVAELYRALRQTDAHIAEVDRYIRDAAERAIAAGELPEAEWRSAGLAGLLQTILILLGFVAVAMWTAYRLTLTNQAHARGIAAAINEMIRTGRAAEVIAQPPAGGGTMLGSAATVAVGLAVIVALLALGKRGAS